VALLTRNFDVMTLSHSLGHIYLSKSVIGLFRVARDVGSSAWLEDESGMSRGAIEGCSDPGGFGRRFVHAYCQQNMKSGFAD
jgi:hypothetical protein